MNGGKGKKVGTIFRKHWWERDHEMPKERKHEGPAISQS
jgi:hypothetical protein